MITTDKEGTHLDADRAPVALREMSHTPVMLNMLEVFGIDPDGISPDRLRWTSLDAYTTMTTVLRNPFTGVISSCWKILDIGVYHCQSMAWAALWS